MYYNRKLIYAAFILKYVIIQAYTIYKIHNNHKYTVAQKSILTHKLLELAV